MIVRRAAITTAVLVWVLLVVGGTSAQTSCVDCHSSQDELAVSRGEPGDAHLEAYLRSTHERAGIGCQGCHGGDATSYNKWVAHRGAGSSQLPSSLTHPGRLPSTCGSCHATLFSAYAAHDHYELLLEGDPRAPSCTTCHGELAGAPDPPAEQACSTCHNDSPDSLAVPFGRRGSELLSLMREVGDLRRKVGSRIRRIRDEARRHDLDEAFFLADAPYQEAIDNGHGFRWDAWQEDIDLAREGFEALAAEVKKKRK